MTTRLPAEAPCALFGGRMITCHDAREKRAERDFLPTGFEKQKTQIRCYTNEKYLQKVLVCSLLDLYANLSTIRDAVPEAVLIVDNASRRKECVKF
jgi:hypothetical protein